MNAFLLLAQTHSQDGPLGSVLGITVAVLFGVVAFLFVASQILFICRPNEALIIAGSSAQANGERVGSQVILAGRYYAIPMLVRVTRIDLTNIEVEVAIQNAYSKGGIPLNVQAIANVKISSDEDVLRNAGERLLGQSRDQIRSVARQNLEGHLRDVIAKLSPEEINGDRIHFAATLAEVAEQDMRKLGLHIDTFNIHHVDDSVNYLSSVGRGRIADIVRQAEIAESDAQREAAQAEAAAKAQAQVAQQKADQAINAKENEIRRLKAELEAQAKSAEERAKAGAETARAVAEQELQKIRVELETKRLAADVVVRSEAENQAKAILARGAAAPIAERGKAIAQSLDLMNQAWLEAGDGANAIVLIQQLETVMRQVVERLDQVKVGAVNLIDRGDGSSLPNYIASYPAAVGQILRELQKTTGIDITGTLAGTRGTVTTLPAPAPVETAAAAAPEVTS